MGISELRQMDLEADPSGEPPSPLERELVESGTISRADASLARMVQNYCAAPLDRVLVSEGLVTEDEVLDAQARLARPCAWMRGDRRAIRPDQRPVDPRA